MGVRPKQSGAAGVRVGDMQNCQDYLLPRTALQGDRTQELCQGGPPRIPLPRPQATEDGAWGASGSGGGKASGEASGPVRWRWGAGPSA